MCLFGDPSTSPSHTPSSTELTAPSSTNEQQEEMSGVDMMIRHFRSRSFREYQLRNSPALSSRSLTRNSPALSSRSLTRSSSPSTPSTPQYVSRTSPSLLHSIAIDFSKPTLSPDMTHAYPHTSSTVTNMNHVPSSTPTHCTSSTLSSECNHNKPYNNKQQRVFMNLIAET
jgi:hypothetical protein